MARKRVIDPDVFHGDSFSDLSFFDRLVYLGVWLNADDEGRLRASSKELKAKLFAHDELPAGDLEASMRRIAAARLIALYEIDGSRFIAVRKFTESQPMRWRTPSKYPAPPADAFKHTTKNTKSADAATDVHPMHAGSDGVRGEDEEERRGEDEELHPPIPPKGGRSGFAAGPF